MPTPRIPPPPPPLQQQQQRPPSAARHVAVTALGVFGGIILLLVVWVSIDGCDRNVSAFKAGYGGPEAMEEHRRKYPPRP